MTSQLFSGDWEYNPTLDAYETAFRAVRFGKPWNGFATPVVTRGTMVAFVARQALLQASGETVDSLAWSDGEVLVIPSQDPVESFRIAADEDDLFDLGVLGYTFIRLTDEDNTVRVIR